MPNIEKNKCRRLIGIRLTWKTQWWSKSKQWKLQSELKRPKLKNKWNKKNNLNLSETKKRKSLPPRLQLKSAEARWKSEMPNESHIWNKNRKKRPTITKLNGWKRRRKSKKPDSVKIRCCKNRKINFRRKRGKRRFKGWISRIKGRYSKMLMRNKLMKSSSKSTKLRDKVN